MSQHYHTRHSPPRIYRVGGDVRRTWALNDADYVVVGSTPRPLAQGLHRRGRDFPYFYIP